MTSCRAQANGNVKGKKMAENASIKETSPKGLKSFGNAGRGRGVWIGKERERQGKAAPA